MDYLNYLDLIDVAETSDDEGAGRAPKRYKDRVDPFLLTDQEFKKKYRFTKPYIRKIVDLIRDDIQQDNRGGGISTELQVLTAIRTWGRQEVQDDAADLHGLSQQSITNICRRVAIALASKSQQFIFMPRNLEEEEEVMSDFQQICGFRQVTGAIDCTHFRVKKVGGVESQYYINRKGFFSLNVQVVCDSKLRIRGIVARWRGSTHDARIFRESTIRERFEAGEFQGRLLGDSGYGLTSFLFTPVLNPRTPREEAYNRAHILTRNVVERCFGVLKQRFRCLLSGFTVSLEHSKLYIIALAVLHNIAIDMGEELEELTSNLNENEPQQRAGNLEGNQEGQAERRLFIEDIFK